MNKFWNVVASLAVILVLVYVGICGAVLLRGDISFDEFKQAALPIVTAALGYMAAMLPKGPAE